MINEWIKRRREIRGGIYNQFRQIVYNVFLIPHLPLFIQSPIYCNPYINALKHSPTNVCHFFFFFFFSAIIQCTTSKPKNDASLSHTNPFLVHGLIAKGGYEAAVPPNNNINNHCTTGVISGGKRVNSYGNLNITTGEHQKSSPRQQQQILLPKELFPTTSNGELQPAYETPRQPKISSNKPRPIKLPLRKHHSFHFQPSQTVAGNKQEKSYLKNYYKANGPLVFKPIKPVPATCQQNSSSTSSTPSPTPPNTMFSLSAPPSSASTADQGKTKNLSHTSPRICGTRLKRHHSNVEAGNNLQNFEVSNGSRGIQTISNGQTTLGVYATANGGNWDGYGTIGKVAGGESSRRLHYVELDENFAQEHTQARRKARDQSFLSDDEGLKRRSRSALRGNESDFEVKGYLSGAETDVNGLVFGAFDDDRLNLKHFKDKYFLHSTGTSGNSVSGVAVSNRTPPKRSGTFERPQQLKSQSTTGSDNSRRTQYATLKFNDVNI